MGNHLTTGNNDSDIEKMKQQMKLHSEELKDLLQRGHTCAHNVEQFPPELKWCKSRNRDYCLDNDVKKLQNNGHKCAHLDYNGNVKCCYSGECIIDYYEDIKIGHPCAVLNKNDMTITTCEREPCIQPELDDLLQQGHICAKINYDTGEVIWCHNYKHCLNNETERIFRDKYNHFIYNSHSPKSNSHYSDCGMGDSEDDFDLYD
jgi:hypothetical protein